MVRDTLLWLLTELVDILLVDKLLSLSEEVLADDRLLLDSVLVLELLRLDRLDSDIVCELLDVVTLWLLDSEELLLLVDTDWLDELLLPVETVERLESEEIDWLDLLLAEMLLVDRLLVLTELVESDDTLLLERLDTLLLLVETLDVLLVETLLVLLVERLDTLDVLRLLVLTELSVLLERLDALDSLNSSTFTIRRS